MTRVGYGLNLTGHLNTWGKDALKGGVFVGRGLDHYMGDYGGNQGLEIGFGAASGCTANTWCTSVPTSWGIYGSYQHFWTDALRSTLGVGYSHVNNNAVLLGAFNNINVANEDHTSVVANLIWSPVPKVDLGVEYIWYHVDYVANPLGVVGGPGNGGTDNRVVVESIFHF
jgi:hypothetical protein